MFWRRRFITVILGLVLACPAFSMDNSDNTNQRKMSLNEEFGDYMVSVQEKIKNTWIPPEVEESGHVTVIFKLDKEGRLISSYIKESSGNLLYDESALNSIKKASPFAAFPAGASKEEIAVMYSFDSAAVSSSHIKDLVSQADKYINRDNVKALSIIDTAIKEIEGDPASYFLYAKRYKIDKIMGNTKQAKEDLEKCKNLKTAYDQRRINKCKEALLKEETPFGYFTLANAYDIAGNYQQAINNIDKAIGMTELNQAYKRYRAEIIMRQKQ